MPPVAKPTASAGTQLVMVAFFAALLLPMAGSRFIATQIVKEQANYASVFGEERASAILSRSDAWFRNAFVKTGLVQSSMKVEPPKPKAVVPATTTTAKKPPGGGFGATSAGQAKPDGGPLNNNPVTKLSRHWIGGAWSIAYLMMCRLSSLLSLLPLLLPLIVAVLMDGSARCKMKWFAFGGSDPKRYVVGLRLGAWSAMFGLFALVSPGSLPSLAIPVLLLLSAVGFAMWMANQQKPM